MKAIKKLCLEQRWQVYLTNENSIKRHSRMDIINIATDYFSRLYKNDTVLNIKEIIKNKVY